MALIKQHGNLEDLFNIQAPRLRTYASMPSWVMDWSTSPDGWWHKHTRSGETYDFHDAAVLRENQLCSPTPYSDKPLFPGEINIADSICPGKVDYLSRIIHQQGITKIVAKILRELDETHGNKLFTKYVNNQPMSQAFVNIHEKGQAGYQESCSN